MARNALPHRLRLRRFIVLVTVVLAGVGGLALEHTATGATTGKPSSFDREATTTVHRTDGTAEHSDANDSDDNDRHCTDGNGEDAEHNKHCRPPSAGTGSHGGDHDDD